MCKVEVTNSKQNHDSLSNYNSTYVQGKGIDVRVPGCDSEDQWFDADVEGDSSLKPHPSCNLKIMKKYPFPHGFIRSGNSRPNFIFVGVNGVVGKMIDTSSSSLVQYVDDYGKLVWSLCQTIHVAHLYVKPVSRVQNCEVSNIHEIKAFIELLLLQGISCL